MPSALHPLELALTLMGVDSTSGREQTIVSLTERVLRERGWAVRRIPVSAGRDNLLATTGDAPLVTFSTHLDTVPPFIAPRVEGDRLFGRGACDAKGIAAAMVVAAERLREQGVPAALLLVVGEETTHDGAHAANRIPTTSRVLIDGEPTESTLALGTKGAMRVVVRTNGVAAHSAYPELGRSATRALVHLLARLDQLELPRDPLLGATTVNIGQLSGGVADNVVAPAAEARLMLRLVSSPGEAERVLRRWIGDRGTLEVGATVPLVMLGTLPGFPTSVVAYATDIPALTTWGTPYLFGPGSIRHAHRDDEHVEIPELRAAVESYVRIALQALERDRGERERAPA